MTNDEIRAALEKAGAVVDETRTPYEPSAWTEILVNINDTVDVVPQQPPPLHRNSLPFQTRVHLRRLRIEGPGVENCVLSCLFIGNRIPDLMQTTRSEDHINTIINTIRSLPIPADGFPLDEDLPLGLPLALGYLWRVPPRWQTSLENWGRVTPKGSIPSLSAAVPHPCTSRLGLRSIAQPAQPRLAELLSFRSNSDMKTPPLSSDDVKARETEPRRSARKSSTPPHAGAGAVLCPRKSHKQLYAPS